MNHLIHILQIKMSFQIREIPLDLVHHASDYEALLALATQRFSRNSRGTSSSRSGSTPAPYNYEHKRLHRRLPPPPPFLMKFVQNEEFLKAMEAILEEEENLMLEEEAELEKKNANAGQEQFAQLYPNLQKPGTLVPIKKNRKDMHILATMTAQASPDQMNSSHDFHLLGNTDNTTRSAAITRSAAAETLSRSYNLQLHRSARVAQNRMTRSYLTLYRPLERPSERSDKNLYLEARNVRHFRFEPRCLMEYYSNNRDSYFPSVVLSHDRCENLLSLRLLRFQSVRNVVPWERVRCAFEVGEKVEVWVPMEKLLSGMMLTKLVGGDGRSGQGIAGQVEGVTGDENIRSEKMMLLQSLSCGASVPGPGKRIGKVISPGNQAGNMNIPTALSMESNVLPGDQHQSPNLSSSPTSVSRGVRRRRKDGELFSSSVSATQRSQRTSSSQRSLSTGDTTSTRIASSRRFQHQAVSNSIANGDLQGDTGGSEVLSDAFTASTASRTAHSVSTYLSTNTTTQPVSHTFSMNQKLLEDLFSDPKEEFTAMFRKDFTANTIDMNNPNIKGGATPQKNPQLPPRGDETAKVNKSRFAQPEQIKEKTEIQKLKDAKKHAEQQLKEIFERTLQAESAQNREWATTTQEEGVAPMLVLGRHNRFQQHGLSEKTDDDENLNNLPLINKNPDEHFLSDKTLEHAFACLDRYMAENPCSVGISTTNRRDKNRSVVSPPSKKCLAETSTPKPTTQVSDNRKKITVTWEGARSGLKPKDASSKPKDREGFWVPARVVGLTREKMGYHVCIDPNILQSQYNSGFSKKTTRSLRNKTFTKSRGGGKTCPSGVVPLKGGVPSAIARAFEDSTTPPAFNNPSFFVTTMGTAHVLNMQSQQGNIVRKEGRHQALLTVSEEGKIENFSGEGARSRSLDTQDKKPLPRMLPHGARRRGSKIAVRSSIQKDMEEKAVDLEITSGDLEMGTSGNMFSGRDHLDGNTVRTSNASVGVDQGKEEERMISLPELPDMKWTFGDPPGEPASLDVSPLQPDYNRVPMASATVEIAEKHSRLPMTTEKLLANDFSNPNQAPGGIAKIKKQDQHPNTFATTISSGTEMQNNLTSPPSLHPAQNLVVSQQVLPSQQDQHLLQSPNQLFVPRAISNRSTLAVPRAISVPSALLPPTILSKSISPSQKVQKTVRIRDERTSAYKGVGADEKSMRTTKGCRPLKFSSGQLQGSRQSEHQDNEDSLPTRELIQFSDSFTLTVRNMRVRQRFQVHDTVVVLLNASVSCGGQLWVQCQILGIGLTARKLWKIVEQRYLEKLNKSIGFAVGGSADGGVSTGLSEDGTHFSSERSLFALAQSMKSVKSYVSKKVESAFWYCNSCCRRRRSSSSTPRSKNATTTEERDAQEHQRGRDDREFYLSTKLQSKSFRNLRSVHLSSSGGGQDSIQSGEPTEHFRAWMYPFQNARINKRAFQQNIRNYSEDDDAADHQQLQHAEMRKRRSTRRVEIGKNMLGKEDDNEESALTVQGAQGAQTMNNNTPEMNVQQNNLKILQQINSNIPNGLFGEDLFVRVLSDNLFGDLSTSRENTSKAICFPAGIELLIPAGHFVLKTERWEQWKR